jgi:hypothetical protein
MVADFALLDTPFLVEELGLRALVTAELLGDAQGISLAVF